MKKFVCFLLAVAMLASAFVFAGAESSAKSVLLLVPTAGGSYFSAAVMGVKALEEKYPGTVTTVVEMGEIPMDKAGAEYELETYRPFFTEACEGKQYDLIICMGAECNPALTEAAKAYPEQLFFSCDMQEALSESLPNVYGLTYLNKDLGYLAGSVAAMVTVSSMEKANPEKKVGVIVGIDVPPLNEYIGGFLQVCKEKGVTVYVDYAGDFIADIAPEVAAKAKAMYDDGVDVVWQVAGAAGSGVFTAAREAGKYAFGVDCDQTQTVEDPAEAETIVTSFYADYAAAIDKTFALVLDGTFAGGTYPTVGLKEGFVGYADNARFNAVATDEVKAGIAELYAAMASGETEVFSVMADPAAFEALRAEVAPKA
ncbi:MAG: BMP family ABC transporter substrate-binding protein [Clostridia bacterium]|nr:BMP family ABC transporter substrate-binding protein [Clostridia bacterium]